MIALNRPGVSGDVRLSPFCEWLTWARLLHEPTMPSAVVRRLTDAGTTWQDGTISWTLKTDRWSWTPKTYPTASAWIADAPHGSGVKQ